jgi:predicted DNA-binding transcriptional regulator YafY
MDLKWADVRGGGAAHLTQPKTYSGTDPSYVNGMIVSMSDTPARLLALLSILQTGRDLTGDELAIRLGVTTRTVRNDMDRLRNLGYRVDSMRGPGGGYWLGPGANIPPLLLDDDETVAITLALRLAAGGSVQGFEEISVQALVKIQQMLPDRLQQRVTSLEGSVEPIPGRGPTVDMDLLLIIATACSNRQLLRFEYRRHDGTSGLRQVEPHRLVNDGHRWYLFAWDAEKQDWRTFRVDRISDARPRPAPKFPLRALPDVAARVSIGAATAMWDYRARVIAHAPAETLVARLPPAVQVDAIDETSCRLHVGSSNAATLARYLALLGVGFSVEEPETHPDLVEALRELSGLLLDAVEGRRADQPGESAARRRASSTRSGS